MTSAISWRTDMTMCCTADQNRAWVLLWLVCGYRIVTGSTAWYEQHLQLLKAVENVFCLVEAAAHSGYFFRVTNTLTYLLTCLLIRNMRNSVNLLLLARCSAINKVLSYLSYLIMSTILVMSVISIPCAGLKLRSKTLILGGSMRSIECFLIFNDSRDKSLRTTVISLGILLTMYLFPYIMKKGLFRRRQSVSPGQPSAADELQFLTSLLGPWQRCRLAFSEVLHDLERTCDPWPQVALHNDHSLQSDQPSVRHNITIIIHTNYITKLANLKLP